ncbi:LysR family transcriptional regulator [Clostridium sp. UBA1652]|uniref:LysR family transcriptional regulator n=1 Tax=Clostridium sp. UBA1652 TaxID=1946348 RepID=UPI00257E9193|nr:LysR family transcriptional regulator [Clostridium sp. UBA1652]
MRLEQLYHIVEVEKCKSISLAAENSYISQPAISSSISKLELELGVTLFKRTNQGMLPTEIGEKIIQEATVIIDKIEELKTIARNDAKDLTGNVIIAVEPSFSSTFMVNIVTSFKFKHPKVNLTLKTGESNNIFHDVISGKADVGIILRSTRIDNLDNINSSRLLKDKLMVISSKKSNLINKESISIKEALKLPVALYNTGYETSCAISQIVASFGKLNVAYRFDNLSILEEVVAEGTSIAFVPKIMMNYYLDKEKIVPIIIEDDVLDVHIDMIWNKRHRISEVEKELVKTIKTMCSICDFM